MNQEINSKEQLRFGEFRADSVDEKARTAEFVISTEAVDSYGTVFKSSGWMLDRYAKNPIVTYQHADYSADPDIVIGTSEVRVENGKLIALLRFESAEDNPLAEKIFRKVKNGILRGASIRASIDEASMGREAEGEDPEVLYFTKQELLSWSPVTVPSNPEALSRNDQTLNAIRSAMASDIEVDERQAENKTMSRFDAQLIINQNSL